MLQHLLLASKARLSVMYDIHGCNEALGDKQSDFLPNVLKVPYYGLQFVRSNRRQGDVAKTSF